MEISGGLPILNRQQIRQDAVTKQINAETDTKVVAARTETGAGAMNIEAAIAMLGGDKISEALSLAGFKVTPENIKLAEALVTMGTPVLPESLHKMNQAFKLTNQNMDEAKFLMSSEMKLNTKNAALLGEFARGENRIINELKNLAEVISAMPESDEKSRLIGILLDDSNNVSAVAETIVSPEINETQDDSAGVAQVADDTTPKAKEATEKQLSRLDTTPDSGEAIEGEPLTAENEKELNTVKNTPLYERDDIEKKKFAESPASKFKFEMPDTKQLFEYVRREKNTDIPLFERLVKRFSMDAAKGERHINEIDEKLNDILETVSKLRAEMRKSGETPRLAAKNPVADTVERLAENIRFQNEIKNSVFVQIPMMVNNKETNAEIYVFKDKKSKKTNASAKSALISLDLLALGHFEAYVHKRGTAVSCQFRVQNGDVQKLIEEHAAKFAEQMDNHGYKLELLMFKQIGDNFTILDREPALSKSLQAGETKGLDSFDQRA